MIAHIKDLIRHNFVANNLAATPYNPDATVEQTPDYCRVDCGLQSDTFNVGIPLTDNPDDGQYAGMVDYFNHKGYPMALWVWDDLPRWQQYLAHTGLPHTETLTGMHAEPATLKVTPETPAGFTIRKVANIADVIHFGNVMAALFGHNPEGENIRRYFAKLAITNYCLCPQVRSFLGMRGDEAVCCGTIVVSDDSIGIYNIATPEGERKKGYGSAMFNFILNYIKQTHAKLCVLQASEDGAGIYKRAGFKPVCDIKVYENRALLTDN